MQIFVREKICSDPYKRGLSAATPFINQFVMSMVHSYKIDVRCINVRVEIIGVEINASNYTVLTFI